MAEVGKIIAELEIVGVDNFKKEIKDAVLVSDKLEQNLKDTGSTGSAAIESITNAGKSLKAQLRESQASLAAVYLEINKLKDSGDNGSASLKILQDRARQLEVQAGQLRDAMSDASQVIRDAGSDTRGLDRALRTLTLFGGASEVVTGATAIFGVESEKLQETLVRLNAVMALTNGLQQIQNELTKEDSIIKPIAAAATKLYSLAVGQSTGAMKLFRLALASTGIGLLIVGIGTLVANFTKLEGSTGRIGSYFKKLGDSFRSFTSQLLPAFNIIANIVEPINKAIIKILEEGAKLPLLKVFLQPVIFVFKNIVDIIANFPAYLAGFFDSTKQAFVGVKTLLSDLYVAFVDTFRAIGDGIRNFDIKKPLDSFKKLASSVSDAFSGTKDAFSNYGKSIADAFKSTVKTVQDMAAANSKATETYENDGNTIIDTNKAIQDSVTSLNGELDKAESIGLTLLKQQLEELKKAFDEVVDKEVDFGNSLANNPTIDEARFKVKALEQQIKDIEDALNFVKTEVSLPTKSAAPIPNDGISKAIDRLSTTQPNPGTEEANKPDAFKQLFGLSRDEYNSELDYRIAVSEAFFSKIADISSQVQTTIAAFSAQNAEAEAQRYESLRQRGLISERNYQRQLARIKTEQARKQRRADLIQASINLPIAVLSAFASTPGGIIVKSIAAAVAGAFAAAQIAQIAKKPLPEYGDGGFFKGDGIVKGNSHARGGVNANLEGGEFVQNKKAVSYYGLEFMENVNAMKFPKIERQAKNYDEDRIAKAIDRSNYKLLKRMADKGMVIENVDEFANALRTRKYV